MSKKILITVLILLVIGFLVWYFGFKKGLFAKLFPKRVGIGEEPTEEDKACNGSREMSGARQSCTKPLYAPTGTSMERAFLKQTDDFPYNTCQEKVVDKNGKEWFYNYSSGFRCIYTDDTSSPWFEPLTEDEQKLWDKTLKNSIHHVMSTASCIPCCSCYNDNKEQYSYNASRRSSIVRGIKKLNESLQSPFWRGDLIKKSKGEWSGYLPHLQYLIICEGCKHMA